MKERFFQVGGCVRDRLLGLRPKDIDFTVEADSFAAMRAAIVLRCGSDDAIKVEHEHFVTIRAVDPVLGGVDFVLARKDGTYTNDGRRPDFVEMGTLADDLARRDFTVNAMAEDDEGNIIDPFNGRADLANMILRCVGGAQKRFAEDSLRMLRAIRFSITKGFTFDDEIRAFLEAPNNAELLANISIERIREELLKCFDKDTPQTLNVLLYSFPAIGAHIFGRNLKLTPTILQK